jgi:hypothetical protein|tara:strand:- start:7165 stop:8094 length:930 start_codon:yes stop_codon:yes gene_type:complete
MGFGYQVLGFGAGGAVKTVEGVEYLIVAGGAGTTGAQAGGGGAGGYRLATTIPGESSGSNSSVEATAEFTVGAPLTIAVGAGGSGAIGGQPNTTQSNGGDSTLDTITSVGGGAGSGTVPPNDSEGLPGGSGGGSSVGRTAVGLGISGQGMNGGQGQNPTAPPFAGGGGGGASQVGSNGPPAGPGGNGLASAISGSSITRAGGGGGAARNIPSSGGSGGGGNGNSLQDSQGGPGNGLAGSANTGGGGGAGGTPAGAGGAGGSGIIILRVPNTHTAAFSPGVTSSSGTAPGFNVYSVTATSGSETVTFNEA